MTQSQAMLGALAAFTGWVLVDAAIKWGSEAALSPYAIMAALGTVGAVSIAVSAAARGEIATLRPISPGPQAFICLCSLVINFGNIIALKHVPLTIYYILVLAAPLVIAALVSTLKHETVTRSKTGCLIAGFVGVVIAIGPRGGAGGEWIGYVAALVGTAAFAAYSVTIRKISPTDNAHSIQFCNAITVGSIGLLGCIGAPSPPLTALAVLLAAGLLNIASNLVYNRALHDTLATNVAQLHYTQIVTGAVVGYFVWHEQLTASLIAGSALIIASGLVVAAQARKLETL
jgi:drug/metabolite transporter (DMT)-like permease